MLNRFKQNIILNIKNIPGWRTKRKILVIECDDWGGIRMPSKEVYKILSNSGLNVSKGRFDKYDTLASSKDLELIFETLNSVRDSVNRPAVITPLTIVANPDFERIRKSEFSKYYYEPFIDTLSRYYKDDNVFNLWQQGISEGIFVPELHGRDHITVQLWMKMLQEGNKDLLLAFKNEFVSLEIQGVPLPANGFRAEFYFTEEDQKPFLSSAIKESASLFLEIFGYMPRVFVPGNGIFHAEFDSKVAATGIKFLNVSHSMAYPVEAGELKYRHFITGQKGQGELIYYTRNCAFEPTENGYQGIDNTMRQIDAAFRWSKPANISTHRVNFVGGIEPANREKGLAELGKLLKAIITKWPDVEFMSSADALEYMKSCN